MMFAHIFDTIDKNKENEKKVLQISVLQLYKNDSNIRISFILFSHLHFGHKRNV